MMTENEKKDLAFLASRLQGVPESSRKLLAHIVELASQGRGDERQQDTAYLPELHESCGLDVEGMYETLGPLQTAGLVEIENQYPFEDVKLTPGSMPLLAISRVCQDKKITLQEVISQSRFDLLD
jgi:hypothetical protein